MSRLWLIVPLCLCALAACSSGEPSRDGFYVGGSAGVDRAERAR